MTTAKSPFHRGKVSWSGDNPGIYLKEREDGPYVTLMVYFRIVLSPHGPGTAMLLLEAPHESAPAAGIKNVLLGDNPALTHYLFDGFCRHFGVFRKLPAMAAPTLMPLDSVSESGDARSAFTVTLKSGNDVFSLQWDDLAEPFAAAVSPAQSATGHHEMYSCFIEARRASITVNGRRLAGKPVVRDFMGRPSSSAFLAFSETWTHEAA
jgi:hypothetical protein